MTKASPSALDAPDGVTRSARSDLRAAVGLGLVAAVVVVVALVMRLVEIVGDDGVAVPVRFEEAVVAVPGTTASTPVTADAGSVVVDGLPPATFASVVLAAVLPSLAALVVIACAVLVFRRVLRGDGFARGTARLVSTASFAVLGGWVAGGLLDTMASNGALALATDRAGEGVVFSVSWLPFLAAMALAGLAVLVRSGERLRDDADGLV